MVKAALTCNASVYGRATRSGLGLYQLPHIFVMYRAKNGNY